MYLPMGYCTQFDFPKNYCGILMTGVFAGFRGHLAKSGVHSCLGMLRVIVDRWNLRFMNYEIFHISTFSYDPSFLSSFTAHA